MKLIDIIEKVKNSRPDATEEFITDTVNSLEAKLIKEIFEPAGIECEKRDINSKADSNTLLLLDTDYSDLYLYHILAVIYAMDMDSEGYNNFMTLYNAVFERFCIYFRKNNRPKSSVHIGGSNI